jgi:uncharacterized protein (DUF1330 family)
LTFSHEQGSPSVEEMPTMPAYVVITKTRTRNPGELALYAKQAPTFMAGHPATFLARFGSCETVEGAAVEGVAIIEFPTFAEAKAWYGSPAYQEASQHRFRGGDYNAVIVEGLAPSPVS